MKKIILVVMVLSSLHGMAQQGEGRHRGPEGKQKINLKPDQQAELQTKKMTLDLNLSEAQQKKIYDLNLKNAEKRALKHTEREKLREARLEEKPSQDEKFNFMNERLDEQIAHKKEMKRILDKNQFETWEREHKKRGQRKAHQRKQRKQRLKRSR